MVINDKRFPMSPKEPTAVRQMPKRRQKIECLKNIIFCVEMSPDPTRPYASILLTRSEKEADPPLTGVLFDLTQREKNSKLEIFQTQSQVIHD